MTLKKSAYTPFAPCVDNTVTQDEATGAADQITTPKLLNDVRVWVSALWTDETNGEIRSIRRWLYTLGCCERERLRIGHRPGPRDGRLGGRESRVNAVTKPTDPAISAIHVSRVWTTLCQRMKWTHHGLIPDHHHLFADAIHSQQSFCEVSTSSCPPRFSSINECASTRTG